MGFLPFLLIGAVVLLAVSQKSPTPATTLKPTPVPGGGTLALPSNGKDDIGDMPDLAERMAVFNAIQFGVDPTALEALAVALDLRGYKTAASRARKKAADLRAAGVPGVGPVGAPTAAPVATIAPRPNPVVNLGFTPPVVRNSDGTQSFSHDAAVQIVQKLATDRVVGGTIVFDHDSVQTEPAPDGTPASIIGTGLGYALMHNSKSGQIILASRSYLTGKTPRKLTAVTPGSAGISEANQGSDMAILSPPIHLVQFVMDAGLGSLLSSTIPTDGTLPPPGEFSFSGEGT